MCMLMVCQQQTSTRKLRTNCNHWLIRVKVSCYSDWSWLWDRFGGTSAQNMESVSYVRFKIVQNDSTDIWLVDINRSMASSYIVEESCNPTKAKVTVAIWLNNFICTPDLVAKVMWSFILMLSDSDFMRTEFVTNWVFISVNLSVFIFPHKLYRDWPWCKWLAECKKNFQTRIRHAKEIKIFRDRLNLCSILNSGKRKYSKPTCMKRSKGNLYLVQKCNMESRWQVSTWIFTTHIVNTFSLKWKHWICILHSWCRKILKWQAESRYI